MLSLISASPIWTFNCLLIWLKHYAQWINMFSKDQDGFVFVNTTWSQEYSSSVKPFNLGGFYFPGIMCCGMRLLAKFHVSSFALSDDCSSVPQTCRTTHFKLKKASSDHLSTKAIKTNSTVNDAAGILTHALPRRRQSWRKWKKCQRNQSCGSRLFPAPLGEILQSNSFFFEWKVPAWRKALTVLIPDSGSGECHALWSRGFSLSPQHWNALLSCTISVLVTHSIHHILPRTERAACVAESQTFN